MRDEGDAGPETPGSKSGGRPNSIGPPTRRIVQKTVPGLLRTLPVPLPECVPYFTKSALACNRIQTATSIQYESQNETEEVEAAQFELRQSPLPAAQRVFARVAGNGPFRDRDRTWTGHPL